MSTHQWLCFCSQSTTKRMVLNSSGRCIPNLLFCPKHFVVQRTTTKTCGVQQEWCFDKNEAALPQSGKRSVYSEISAWKVDFFAFLRPEQIDPVQGTNHLCLNLSAVVAKYTPVNSFAQRSNMWGGTKWSASEDFMFSQRNRSVETKWVKPVCCGCASGTIPTCRLQFVFWMAIFTVHQRGHLQHLSFTYRTHNVHGFGWPQFDVQESFLYGLTTWVSNFKCITGIQKHQSSVRQTSSYLNLQTQFAWVVKTPCWAS